MAIITQLYWNILLMPDIGISFYLGSRLTFWNLALINDPVLFPHSFKLPSYTRSGLMVLKTVNHCRKTDISSIRLQMWRPYTFHYFTCKCKSTVSGTSYKSLCMASPLWGPHWVNPMLPPSVHWMQCHQGPNHMSWTIIYRYLLAENWVQVRHTLLLRHIQFVPSWVN